MSKQQQKQQSVKPTRKTNVAPEFNSFGYLMRNLAVVAVLAFILFFIDKLNEQQSELPELYQEFSQLRQKGGNPERQQELYNQIMAIQNDNSFIKKVTRGYHWAIHDVAIRGSENVEEVKNKAGKPLTLDDKFAMRVGAWPLIDYINKNTPPNAVIYLPQSDSVLASGKWINVYDPGWMEYFIYPRLSVSIGGEKYHPYLAKRVTHVVILEGKGYDKLKYDVPLNQRVQEGVFPVDHPPAQTQSQK